MRTIPPDSSDVHIILQQRLYSERNPPRRPDKMNRTLPRLVRVFYEPPPFGPRTALNRPAYGMEGGTTPLWVEKINKMPSWQPIVGELAVIALLLTVAAPHYEVALFSDCTCNCVE